MKYRIALWALAGLIVAAGWFFYATATFPSPITPAQPLVWNLALLTQPIVFAGFHFHFGIRFYWVFLANAATYALLGLMVEAVRWQLPRPASF
jgi:hypothetical protein